MKPWWERIPGRLEFEIAELESAGYSCERDEDAFRAGYGALRLTAPIKDGCKIPLLIRFPYFYPHFQFLAFANELNLKLHQNPFSKNLCLIGRDPENWHPRSTVAQVLEEMLPKVLVAGQTNDAEVTRGLEQDQAEPFSEYYAYFPGSSVLWDGGWSLPPEIPGGSLTIGFHPNRHNENQFKAPMNAAVISVTDSNGKVLLKADSRISDLYCAGSLTGKWIRIEEPIKEVIPEKFLSRLTERSRFLREFVETCEKRRITSLIGVVFPEEVARRTTADGWVFLYLKPVNVAKRQVKMASTPMRPQRAGLSDMGSRLPCFQFMNHKKIALAGLGCLGAPSALEFARSGIGQLRLLDCDTVDVGTTVRWPLGLAEAGNNKIDSLGAFIKSNYPYTEVIPFNLRLGQFHEDVPVKSDLEIIDEFMEGVDLVFDASADLNVNHLLSELAGERQIPYIAVSTTYGAWGGQIVRIRPGKTQGCWYCYRHCVETTKSIPSANSDPRGKVQPGGCGSPTYTGAGFDTQEISLGAVRLAVSTLTCGEENGYPLIDWDVAIINLRNSKGDPIPPQWQTFSLERHPSCHCRSDQ